MPTKKTYPRPFLLTELKRLLKQKGIKYSYWGKTSDSVTILTKPLKDIPALIFCFEDLNYVTIRTIPMNGWSFGTRAVTVAELLKKVIHFNNILRKVLQ